MKLKCSFESVDMGEEIVAVPVGDGADQVHGILKLNKTGLEILNMIKNKMKTEEIINVLSTKYENDINEINKNVFEVIEILKKNKLIEE